ncbi:MFS transporter [Enemella sp. A6]|uniref:MFS transporter n=1 Tax=Enemella sp. A6 TaxID=3440152 RepID=UPI003EBEB1E0
MIRRVWPLVVAAIALGIDAYVLAGVLPQIATSLTTSVAMIGLGVTAFTAAYAVAGPLLSGRLTRGSTARALLVALGVFNLGNLITTIAPGIEVFLVSRVVAGAGAGILTAVATATAAAMVSDQQWGRAMAMVTFGLSTGTVAGVPVGMLIGEVSAGGGRWAWSFSSGPSAWSAWRYAHEPCATRRGRNRSCAFCPGCSQRVSPSRGCRHRHSHG